MHAGVEDLERRVSNAPGIVMISFGTPGAGKSTFLTAVHRELGYSQAQIPIFRGRQVDKSQIYRKGH